MSSSTVRSYGFIAILTTPIEGDQARDDMFDKLYEAKSNLQISYDGTMVYNDFNARKSYQEREDIYGLFIGDQHYNRDEFFAECDKYGIVCDKDSAQSYNCIWYNGCDSPMSMQTLEAFKKASQK